jgi:hypothetical protein
MAQASLFRWNKLTGKFGPADSAAVRLMSVLQPLGQSQIAPLSLIGMGGRFECQPTFRVKILCTQNYY